VRTTYLSRTTCCGQLWRACTWCQLFVSGGKCTS